MYKKEINGTRLFNKQNVIMHSAVELTLLEQNIFNLFQYILTKAYKLSYATKCIIPYAAFRHFMGSKITGSVEDVKDAFFSLHSKKIILNVLNTRGDKKVATSSVSMIGDCIIPEFDFDNIEIEIPEHIINLIRSGKDDLNYTSSLLQITKMSKNKYTPRLYDFLYRYASAQEYIPIPKLSIKSFRGICGVKEAEVKNGKIEKKAQYDNIAELTRGVIQKAKDEMSTKFNLDFDFDFERVGRKIKYITFTFTNDQRKAAIKYIENEAKKALSVKDDVLITAARKHAAEQTLQTFNKRLVFSSISHIEDAGEALHYKIVLKNGKYEKATFDQIKAVLDYLDIKATPGVVCSAPMLYNTLNPSEYDFDPTIVIAS